MNTLSPFRRAVLFLLLLALPIALHAQDGLAVAQVFQKYGAQKGCKMVTLYDGKLKGYSLKVYKSLTYKRNGDDIAAMLQADRKRAKKIREVVVDGQVASGYYMMPALTEGINRFVLFRNYEEGGGAVIYIEGRLSPDDILKLTRR